MSKTSRNKWMKQAMSITLGLSLVLTGCGKGEQPEGSSNGEGKKVRIGMVTASGTINDNSFNQSTWEGMKRLEKDTGSKVQYLQSASDSEIIPNLNQFVKGNFDLTWGVGFLMTDHMKKIADENPNAKLGIIDSVVEAPNVTSVVFKENEGSFLTGVVAALMTKTKKVGYVGGMELPVIKRFEAGFKAGVKAAKPDVEIVSVYTGAFDKPDLGKAAASTLYGQGVDIIFHAASSTGDGIFNEAKDRKSKGQNVWVIGVDKDQSLLFGDEVTLTSMEKRVDEAVYRLSKDFINGKFDGGKSVALGLAENGVGLPETSKKNVPADVLKKVEEFKQKIIQGEIKVPEK